MRAERAGMKTQIVYQGTEHTERRIWRTADNLIRTPECFEICCWKPLSDENLRVLRAFVVRYSG